MEWLTHIFNNPSDEPRNVKPSADTGYKTYQAEDEALDRAVSLSLHEHYQRSAKGHDTDEDLARAFQESTNLLMKPEKTTGSSTVQLENRLCSGCSTGFGSGSFVNHLDKFWHPHCFRCHLCHTPICRRNFSTWEKHPYHSSCIMRLSLPKCDICNNFFPANSAGAIEYRVHPFWKQKYCPKHESDGTPRCASCERFQIIGEQHVSLDDGRKLCLQCLNLSIMDTEECQPLYYSILDFYEGLNMKINQHIPMLLVERQALNTAQAGHKRHHNIPETRGLCLSEERSINMITRRPTLNRGNKMVDLKRTTTNLKRHFEVTAILVLYGLPRLLTGSLIAHESMHAWLRLNGFRKLDPVVEEGICQVMAHLWLESEVMAGSSSTSKYSVKSSATNNPIEKKLGNFFLQQITNDNSPIYGKGFQAGYASMMRFGLPRTLNHIKMTGSFPL